MSGSDGIRKRKVVVKDYYLKELADIYDLSEYRMRKKIRKLQNRIGKRKEGMYAYDADQVALIFLLIKLPSHVEVIKV